MTTFEVSGMQVPLRFVPRGAGQRIHERIARRRREVECEVRNAAYGAGEGLQATYVQGPGHVQALVGAIDGELLVTWGLGLVFGALGATFIGLGLVGQHLSAQADAALSPLAGQLLFVGVLVLGCVVLATGLWRAVTRGRAEATLSAAILEREAGMVLGIGERRLYLGQVDGNGRAATQVIRYDGLGGAVDADDGTGDLYLLDRVGRVIVRFRSPVATQACAVHPHGLAAHVKARIPE